MRYPRQCLALAAALLIVSAVEARQGAKKTWTLESVGGLRLHNVTAEPVALDGKKGLRVRISDEAARKLDTMPPEEQLHFAQLAILEGSDFGSGSIEAEIAGAPAPGAPEGA